MIDRGPGDRPAPTTLEGNEMSNDKMDATGYTPASDPWAALAAHGEVEPDPAVDRTHYRSPGVPPWGSLHQDIGHEEKRRGLPAWAWVSIILGGLLVICGSSAAVSLFSESGPAPAVRTSAAAPVATSGTCEKKIVGEYGLVATVRATNATDKPQTGALWVRWPVTGEAAQEFSRFVTILPGQTVELPVNQEVPAERWFRTGACSYGWTPAPPD